MMIVLPMQTEPTIHPRQPRPVQINLRYIRCPHINTLQHLEGGDQSLSGRSRRYSCATPRIKRTAPRHICIRGHGGKRRICHGKWTRIDRWRRVMTTRIRERWPEIWVERWLCRVKGGLVRLMGHSIHQLVNPVRAWERHAARVVPQRSVRRWINLNTPRRRGMSVGGSMLPQHVFQQDQLSPLSFVLIAPRRLL